MKKKQKKIKFESIETVFKVIERDLRSEFSIEGVSMSVMECLEDKVSPELLELLKQMLLGFNDDMQLEMADDLLDFAHGHMIHTTGCLSADAVLEACYGWIAEEQGIDFSKVRY